MNYRPDIDGLRAIAVMVIVLFHMGLRSLSGGFVGVDVFFVISGFLITTLVLRDIEARHFSFRTFYMRRLRRLGPALLVTLLGTLAAGYVVLGPEHYSLLAKSAVATVLSVSNILFWTESGYFDAEAIYKPLLHTWSLAVEEQFYLVWPSLLLLSFRFGRRGVAICLIVLSLASLVAAEAFLPRNPAAVFFLTPFRIYEFALGAGLALMPGRGTGRSATRSVVSLAGVAMILAAALTFEEQMRFPGFSALLPCVGTAMVIWAGAAAWPNRFLAMEPMRFLGRISYSLYLVHWPVVVFYAYSHGAPTTAGEVIALTLVAIALGSLMYLLVETPFRRYRRGDRAAGFRVSGRALGMSSLAAAATTIALSTGVLSLGGLPGRLPADIATLEDQISAGKRGRVSGIRQDRCHFSTKSQDVFDDSFEECLPAGRENMIVVLGDSHAADIWLALSRMAPDRNIVQLTGAGCSQSRDFSEESRCLWFLDFTSAWIAEHAGAIDVVLYSQSAGNAMDGDAEIDAEAMTVDTSGVERLRTRLEEIAALGVEVVFWGPRPEFHPRVDVTLASSDTIGQFNLRMQQVNMDQFATLDATFARAFEGSKVRYFSSQQALCDPDCLYLRPDGGPIVVDYGHWAPEGGSYVLETMLSRYPDLAELIDGNAH